jgi:hypothetical protein
MKPVDQTTFGFPGGNCFSACVATILNLPLDCVPYFMTGDDWWQRFSDWADDQGILPVYIPDYPPPDDMLGRGDVYAQYLLGGQSPRRPDDPTMLHSVVAEGTEIVHDPHPSRAGLLTRQDCIFLVRFPP